MFANSNNCIPLPNGIFSGPGKLQVDFFHRLIGENMCLSILLSAPSKTLIIIFKLGRYLKGRNKAREQLEASLSPYVEVARCQVLEVITYFSDMMESRL